MSLRAPLAVAAAALGLLLVYALLLAQPARPAPPVGESVFQAVTAETPVFAGSYNNFTYCMRYSQRGCAASARAFIQRSTAFRSRVQAAVLRPKPTCAAKYQALYVQAMNEFRLAGSTWRRSDLYVTHLDAGAALVEQAVLVKPSCYPPRKDLRP